MEYWSNGENKNTPAAAKAMARQGIQHTEDRMRKAEVGITLSDGKCD
jgi:hypothetical protein